MKAIYLVKYGKSDTAFEIRETSIPIPAADEVVIKVNVSGLNFADVVARKGLYPEAPKNPALLGYDVAGTIYAKGENVKNFDIGDFVVALTRFGGYAEYAKTKAQVVLKIPQNLDPQTATALATQACTAYYCAQQCVQIHKNEKVLIHAAAGGVGSILVQIAKHKGAIVYATASASKHEYLKQLGADVIIDYTKQDFEEEIKKTNTQIDTVFDSVGGYTFKKSKRLLKPGGKIICYGASSQITERKSIFTLLKVGLGFGFFSPIPLLMKSQAIIGVNMLKIADYKPELFEYCFKEVLKLWEQKVIQPHLAKTFSYTEIKEAHDFLESRKSIGKVCLIWE